MWTADKKEIIVEDRGRIIPIADGVFRCVMIIESKKGAVRANHWHKTDSHVMYIVSGKARYIETAIEEPSIVLRDIIVGPEESIITEPCVGHAMEFLEDTVMVVATRNDRDYETYMNDIVKMEILNVEVPVPDAVQAL